MKAPLKLDDTEISRLLKEVIAVNPPRELLTTPTGKLKRVEENRWAFDLVRQWRTEEAQAARS